MGQTAFGSRIGEDNGLPDSISYDATTRTLTVGTGSIRPVAPEVWDYRIGGVQVIRTWFSFRKRKPDVERQTPLNDILPPTWPSRWTIDLPDLINVLGLLVALEPQQARLLNAVSSGPLSTTEISPYSDAPFEPHAWNPPPRARHVVRMSAAHRPRRRVGHGAVPTPGQTVERPMKYSHFRTNARWRTFAAAYGPSFTNARLTGRSGLRESS